MDKVAVVVAVIGACGTLLLGSFLAQWLASRGRLGATLWCSKSGTRWLTYLWLFFAVDSFFDVAKSGRIDTARSLADLLTGIMFLLGAVVQFFPPDLVRIRERGIETGLLAVSWDQVKGWAWTPELEPSRTLGIERTGEGKLHLWLETPWRRVYQIRAARPLRTGMPYSSEAAALLESHAPPAGSIMPAA